MVLLVAPDRGGMRRLPPPPHAKGNFDLDREGLVAVVAVGVAGAAACLGFESIWAFPLVSLSSSELNFSCYHPDPEKSFIVTSSDNVDIATSLFQEEGF